MESSEAVRELAKLSESIDAEDTSLETVLGYVVEFLEKLQQRVADLESRDN